MKEFYLARVKEAQSIDELEYIIERAADDLKNNTDYEEIYNAAMGKIAVWKRIAQENRYDERF